MTTHGGGYAVSNLAFCISRSDANVVVVDDDDGRRCRLQDVTETGHCTTTAAGRSGGSTGPGDGSRRPIGHTQTARCPPMAETVRRSERSIGQTEGRAVACVMRRRQQCQ